METNPSLRAFITEIERLRRMLKHRQVGQVGISLKVLNQGEPSELLARGIELGLAFYHHTIPEHQPSPTDRLRKWCFENDATLFVDEHWQEARVSYTSPKDFYRAEDSASAIDVRVLEAMHEAYRLGALTTRPNTLYLTTDARRALEDSLIGTLQYPSASSVFGQPSTYAQMRLEHLPGEGAALALAFEDRFKG